VIAEVYALLMLFAALLLWILVRWRDEKQDRYLWLAAFVLGLALGNHLTIIFWAPAALVFLWPDRRRWLRVRTVLPAVALFIIGLAIYAYLPLAARHRPPVNWGNPKTWDGFKWVVTGEQYQQFAFGLRADGVPARLATWALLLGDQFGWWGLAISLVGAWGQWGRDRRFALFTLVWMSLAGVYAFFYATGDSHMYLLPVIMVMALWFGEGAYHLLELVRPQRAIWQRAALVLLILLPLGSVALHWQAVKPDDDGELRAYFDGVLDAVPPGSLIIVRADQPTFALWYAVYAEGIRPDVQVVSGPMLAFIWYRDHVRHLYPELTINEPTGQNLTWDDLVYDLVASNTSVPTYMTDFKEEWREWFDIDKVEGTPIYHVGLVGSSGP
jgi:4-amino-4-deoxy-L-arabinose transferase-like glycosyltransferase